MLFDAFSLIVPRYILLLFSSFLLFSLFKRTYSFLVNIHLHTKAIDVRQESENKTKLEGMVMRHETHMMDAD